MRWPRVRFTIRSAMIAVALAGFLLAALQLMRRHAVYRKQAELHRALGAEQRARVQCADRMAAKGYISRQAMEDSRSKVAYHARMSALYEQAAARPWMSVSTEPNE